MSAAGSVVEAILDVRDHLRHLQRAQRMHRWIPLQAEIVVSEVKFTADGVPTKRGGRLDGWHANLVVRYQRGIPIETAMRPIADESPIYVDKQDAEDAIKPYIVTHYVEVWVNPDDPHEAVFKRLEAGESLAKVIGAAMIALFFGGAIFWYFAWPFFR